MVTDLTKVFLPALMSFLIGIMITPILTTFFYNNKLWKRVRRDDLTTNPTITPEFAKIHSDEEIHTPRVGGSIIWLCVLIVSGILFLASVFFPNDTTAKLDFISRNQTFLPFVALIFGALFGLCEDLFEIFGKTGAYIHGLKGKYLVMVVAAVGLIGGWWFYTKLGVDSVLVPFFGTYYLGALIVPFFMVVTFGTFSSRVIDGLDGLSGGVMAIIFAAYGIIAYFNNQIDLAAFCAVILGGILVFLWWNIAPARFYMGETGMFALTLALVVVAFLTNAVLLLPIIGLPLMATALSSAIQMGSKRLRNGKTVFRVAPLHHHFQAIGWTREKVVMRYWIITVMSALMGIIIYFVGK